MVLLVGTRASKTTSLPGPPQQVELAFLGGLLERGGFVAARPNLIGLKIVGDPRLVDWLAVRFGGRASGRTWWCLRQADVVFVLGHVRPYLVTAIGTCDAMRRLLEHIQGRASYHGDDEWRDERERLLRAVRAARAAAA